MLRREPGHPQHHIELQDRDIGEQGPPQGRLVLLGGPRFCVEVLDHAKLRLDRLHCAFGCGLFTEIRQHPISENTLPPGMPILPLQHAEVQLGHHTAGDHHPEHQNDQAYVHDPSGAEKTGEQDQRPATMIVVPTSGMNSHRRSISLSVCSRWPMEAASHSLGSRPGGSEPTEGCPVSLPLARPDRMLHPRLERTGPGRPG